MNIITNINDSLLRMQRRYVMERAKRNAINRTKETGRTHYVVNVDGKPLVMNSHVVKVLKKRRMIDKNYFAPMEAIYTAKF